MRLSRDEWVHVERALPHQSRWMHVPFFSSRCLHAVEMRQGMEG